LLISVVAVAAVVGRGRAVVGVSASERVAAGRLLRLGELDLLDGVSGQGRRGGQMSALSPETVLVGDVVDGVDDAIGAGVRVGALGDLDLVLAAGVLQVSLLLGVDAVAGSIAARTHQKKCGQMNGKGHWEWVG